MQDSFSRNEVTYINDGSDDLPDNSVEPVGNNIGSVLISLADKAQKELLASKKSSDYFKDGVLYCGNCNSPKSYLVERNGKQWLMSRECNCAKAERIERERSAEAERREREEEKFRARFMTSPRLRSYTFENWETVDHSTGTGSESEYRNRLLRYVSFFPYMKQNGMGLFLYGELGIGKSYGAACIVNALSKQRYSCMMTNFSTLYNALWNTEGRQDVIERISKYDLLVIDDLGAEYQSEYARSLLFEVVDSRYRSGLPMVVTSNLSLDDLMKCDSGLLKRCYDRILEMCHPVPVRGVNRRSDISSRRFSALSRILNGKSVPEESLL